MRSSAWSAFDATIHVFVRFLVEERAVHDALYDGPAGSVTIGGKIDDVWVVTELVAAGVAEVFTLAADPLLAGEEMSCSEVGRGDA